MEAAFGFSPKAKAVLNTVPSVKATFCSDTTKASFECHAHLLKKQSRKLLLSAARNIFGALLATAADTSGQLKCRIF